MNTDIRLAVGFWFHPKTKRLIRELGLDGVRSLQILWCWVAQNRPDGEISDMDADDIEAAADWNGNQGVFFEAIRTRWIDEVNGRFFVHDWEDHNSWVADSEQRSDEARLIKLSQTNRHAYEQFRSCGRTGISRREYQQAKSASKQHASETLQRDASETLQRDASETLQREAVRFATAPSPAPAPLPYPAPALKEYTPPSPPTGGEAHMTESKADLVTDEIPMCTEKATGVRITQRIALCPYDQIFTSYADNLPELPQPHDIRDENLRKTVKSAWAKHPHLDWWLSYWQHVRASPYLMGQVNDWKASFPWLIGPKNMGKVLGGQYHGGVEFTVSKTTLKNMESLKRLRAMEGRNPDGSRSETGRDPPGDGGALRSGHEHCVPGHV